MKLLLEPRSDMISLSRRSKLTQGVPR